MRMYINSMVTEVPFLDVELVPALLIRTSKRPRCTSNACDVNFRGNACQRRIFDRDLLVKIGDDMQLSSECLSCHSFSLILSTTPKLVTGYVVDGHIGVKSCRTHNVSRQVVVFRGTSISTRHKTILHEHHTHRMPSFLTGACFKPTICQST